MSRTILTIEDDPAIRRGIVDALRFAGYRPLEAGDGRLGRELALTADYDLLLLDLVLPHLSGLEILAALREIDATRPAIVLTAKGDEDDRVEGLRLGADDYVVKPFSVRELLARVEAVLRRSPARPRDVRRIPLQSAVIDLERGEVQFADGRCVELSAREVDLLAYLARNADRSVSREELLANVWRIDPNNLVTRTIDMHVARLREKLADDPSAPRVIQTVRGKGYMLCLAATEDSPAR